MASVEPDCFPNLTGEWHEVWGSVGRQEGVVGGLSLWEEEGKVHGAHITAEGAGPPGTCSIVGTTALNAVSWTFVEWGTVFDGRVDPSRNVIQGLCVRETDGDTWRVKFQRTSVGGGLTDHSRSTSPADAHDHLQPPPALPDGDARSVSPVMSPSHIVSVATPPGCGGSGATVVFLPPALQPPKSGGVRVLGSGPCRAPAPSESDAASVATLPAPPGAAGSPRLAGVESRYLQHLAPGAARAKPLQAQAVRNAAAGTRNATPTRRGAGAKPATPRGRAEISDRLARLTQPPAHRRCDSRDSKSSARPVAPSPAGRAGLARAPQSPALRVISRGGLARPAAASPAPAARPLGTPRTPSGRRGTPTKQREAAMTPSMQRLSAAVQSRGEVALVLPETELLQLEAYRAVALNKRMRQKKAAVDAAAKQLKLLSVLAGVTAQDATDGEIRHAAAAQHSSIAEATDGLSVKQRPHVADVAASYDTLVQLLNAITHAPLATPEIAFSPDDLQSILTSAGASLAGLVDEESCVLPPAAAAADAAARVAAVDALCGDAITELQFLADFLRSGILLRYLSLKADLHRRRGVFASFASPQHP